jgi:hypothetical protein
MQLADTLGLAYEHSAMDELQHWLYAAANGPCGDPPTALGSNMAGWFGSMPTDMAQVTEGWGALRILVPLTLAFLGLRGLLYTKHLPFPTWYDYLWFAFSSFMVLHPPRALPQAQV